MNTLKLESREEDLKTAAVIIAQGGVVAVPTETVYGLAADALNGNAVKKIFKAKGRPADNPLIVHISNIRDIERFRLVSIIPEKASLLMDTFWPGPLTIIMNKGLSIPDEVSAGLPTVAVRYPSHKTIRRIIELSQKPLAAPSANLSGSPSPTTYKHVLNDMDGRIDAIVDGGDCSVGVESTVISLAFDEPRLLRPGFITLEELESVIGPVKVDKAVLDKIDINDQVSSPGMKYKHYAPRARVVLVRDDKDRFASFVNSKINEKTAVICYDEEKPGILGFTVSIGKKDDLKEQARKLFDALRQVDRDDIELVFAHVPETRGVGLALYNRLIRAAGFEVINIE